MRAKSILALGSSSFSVPSPLAFIYLLRFLARQARGGLESHTKVRFSRQCVIREVIH